MQPSPSKQLTCVQLVRAYLNRIESDDDKGPALNAILTVNPRALEIAADMDRLGAAGNRALQPLHCIPVVVKDNYNTVDMPTTGGSVTLARSVPLDDAFVVKRLRQAGALILAKSNLTELARGGTTVSSLGGQTKNPYDLTRTPGGSSGGTGAAIAANFAVLGTGSDTGQSIRSPASAQSLVGLRPTRGLVSRDGIIPFSTTQDEAGPITRTVEDAARMLDVIAGYDAADPVTAFSLHKIPPSYTTFLDRDGLRGVRIGALMDVFGKDAVHREVNAVVEAAIEKLAEAGATIVRFNIANIEALTRDLDLGAFEFKAAFNRYLSRLGPGAPVKTLDEFMARGEFHRSLKSGLEAAQRTEGVSDPEYRARVAPPPRTSTGGDDGDGGPQVGRHHLSASAAPGGINRRGATGAQRRALQRHRISRPHGAGRVLRADELRADRRADRHRAPGSRVERACSPQARRMPSRKRRRSASPRC